MKLSQIKKIIFPLFILGIIYFFSKTIYSNFQNILNFEFQINILYLLSSVLIGFFVILYWGFLWKILIKGVNLRLKDIFYIHSISWLAKYIPGKAGTILSKIFFLSQHGVSKKQGLVTSIYENIFQILGAFIISIPIIIYYFAEGLSNYYLGISIIFIVGFLIFIYPPVFYGCVNLGLKIFKKDLLEKKFFLGIKEIIINLFLYSLGTILNGFAFFLMIKGITPISWDLLLPIIGIWNFAGVIGLLAIFAPAGIGVREGILILFLGYYFPVEIATLISIFSRLWTTLLDGLIGIYVLIYRVLDKKEFDFD